MNFNSRKDRLWFVGDLVNRGPKSTEVLRWVRDLGDAAVTVLGNHDLHLLGRAAGLRKRKAMDTLASVMNAPDCEELVDWLRARPLIYTEQDYVLVHAGLHPSWSVEDAKRIARDVEKLLRSDDWMDRIGRFYGSNGEVAWSDELRGEARLKSSVAYLTRVRACMGPNAQLKANFSGELGDLPRDSRAWFQYKSRAWDGSTVVFGHWSALGLHIDENVMCIDTGCVWGEKLTAVRLDDGRVYQQPAID